MHVDKKARIISKFQLLLEEGSVNKETIQRATLLAEEILILLSESSSPQFRYSLAHRCEVLRKDLVALAIAQGMTVLSIPSSLRNSFLNHITNIGSPNITADFGEPRVAAFISRTKAFATESIGRAKHYVIEPVKTAEIYDDLETMPSGRADFFDNPKVRRPKIRALGLKFHPFYFHTIMMKTVLGEEVDVARQIDGLITNYIGNCRAIGIAHKEKQNASLYGNRSKETSAFSPIFCGLTGDYCLSANFFSIDPTLNRQLGKVDGVQIMHPHLGIIPCLVDNQPLAYLRQDNPLDFITPYKSKPFSYPEHVCSAPVFVHVELECTSIVSAIGGLGYLSGFIPVLDSTIGKSINGLPDAADLSGLVTVSVGKSSLNLYIRTSNVDHIGPIVVAIRQLTIDYFLDAWAEVNVGLKGCSPSVVEHAAFKRRYTRLMCAMNDFWIEHSGNSQPVMLEEDRENTIISRTYTTIGFLSPLPQHALHYEQEVRAGGVSDKTSEMIAPWKLTGTLLADIRIATKCGWFFNISDTLRQIGFRSRIKFALGEQDITIRLDELSSEESLPFRPARVVGILFWLRRLFFKQHIDSDLLPVFDIWSDVQIDVADSRHSPKRESLPISEIFNAALGEAFFHEPSNRLSKLQADYSAAIKAKHVDRDLVDRLFDSLTVWWVSLRNEQNLGSMIELIDSWHTFISMLHAYLSRSSTTGYEIYSFLHAFVSPFSAAILQRLNVNHSRDRVQLISEFPGAMASIHSSYEELLHGIAAVVGAPGDVGSFAVVSAGARAQISIHRQPVDVAEQPEKNGAEKIFGIVRLHEGHLEYPNRIHVLLHEMLHLIVESHDFLRVMSQTEPMGRLLLNVLEHKAVDSKHQLFRERLQEFVVEFGIGYLAYADDPALYAKIYIIQVACDSEAHSRSEADNLVMLEELLARGFIQYLNLNITWDDGEDVEFWPKLKDIYQDWWRIIFPFLPMPSYSNSVTVAERLRGSVEEIVTKNWLQNSDMSVYLRCICETWSNYFSNSRCRGAESWRALFYDRLAECVRDADVVSGYLSPVDSFLSSAVCFDFAENEESDVILNLRERRLESLMGYLVMIRAYYAVLIGQMEQGDKPQWHCLHRTGQNLREVAFSDVDSMSFGSVLLDARDGSIILIGNDAMCSYSSLRVAFQASLMHLAEVTKYSDMYSIMTHQAVGATALFPSISHLGGSEPV